MKKKVFTWKIWLKRSLLSLPLTVAVFLMYPYGRNAVFAISILVFYIAYLYDKQWQKEIKSFNSQPHE